MDMHGFDADEIVSVGDSEMDLSMMIEGSHFIGFNPSRESSLNAFTKAGIPIVTQKDLSMILEHIQLPSGEGN